MEEACRIQDAGGMQCVYTYEVIGEHQRRGTVGSADVHLNGDIGALSRGGDAGDG